LFRLGATIPKPKSHTSSESTKMDVEDEEHVSSSSHHHHAEPPKVESEPESDLG
jgi:hypothetical protein